MSLRFSLFLVAGQSTVDLVQNTMGMDVIYGDTDSIMINTNTENLPDVRKPPLLSATFLPPCSCSV
jgi:hypothetical protein